MAPGTTLAEPVAANHKPDLENNLHEITEYFESQQAYDLFDFMLRELLITQPQDPLQHLINCLDAQTPSGPLQIFVSSVPGVSRADVCRRLADNYGLSYISSGELLRDHGVKTDSLSGYADDDKVSEIVLDVVLQARKSMQGFVIDGFPRTRLQTCKLKDCAIVPTHVLVLKATSEALFERQRQIADGKLEGDFLPDGVLEGKLNEYVCHCSSALEVYADRTKEIDASIPPEAVYAQMEQCIRMLPRSRGPALPPRILILGPRGTGTREHASRLASRFGAVFIDGGCLQQSSRPNFRGIVTSIDLPNLDAAARQDPLGIVGVRLRQPDCKAQGYVLCGFLSTPEEARTLAEDVYLCPTRVVALEATVDTCVARLKHLAKDPVTGKVWTTRPRNEAIRNRLQRNPEDIPEAVEASHEAYSTSIRGILSALGSKGSALIQADRGPEEVFNDVVEFVERPLPLPPVGF